MRLKRSRVVVLLLILLLMGAVGRVQASDGMRGDHCVVAEDEYIVEDFYFACRVLEIHGTIDGDLVGVASDIVISQTGAVTGDLWVGGGRVTIAGTVGDDVHFAGLSVIIEAPARFTNARTDVTSAALNTEIQENASIPGDLLVYGYQAEISGIVGGDVDFGGESLSIGGYVGGRIDASVGDSRRSNDVPSLPIYNVSFKRPGLRIDETARIVGDLSYSSAYCGTIPVNAVQGRTYCDLTSSQDDIRKAKESSVAARILVNYIRSTLRDMLTLMIIGAAVLRFFPNLIRQPAQTVKRRMVPSLAGGLLTFVLSFPASIVMILISLMLIGILLLVAINELTIVVGLTLLSANLAMIGGFAFLLLFMGRVVISFTLGHFIYRYAMRITALGSFRRWIVILAIGTAIYALIVNVPIPTLGLVLQMLASFVGIGAVTIYLRDILLTSAAAVVTSVEASTPVFPFDAQVDTPSVEQPTIPPPVREKPLGMENLPDGFTWFEDN
jgi:hypothetical protein